MKRIYCGIVPPIKIHNKISRLRAELLRLTKLNQKYFPLHISLRTTFWIGRYEAFTRDLEEFAKQYEPFILKINGHKIFNNKVLVLNVDKTKILEKLEKEVVCLAQKYKKCPRCFSFTRLSGQKLKYFKKYGDPFIFEYYKPHMTLLYDIKNQREKLEQVLKKSNLRFNFLVNKLTIIEKTNKHKIIKHILLGNK